MAARNDDRDSPAHMRETQVEQRIALAVRKQELFRVVGQNADPVDALCEHAIEYATLSFEIQLAGLREWRRCNREYPRERSGRAHVCSSSSC